MTKWRDIRAISLILTVIMVFSMMTMPVSAADGSDIDDTVAISFTRLSADDVSFKVDLDGSTVKRISCSGEEIDGTLYNVTTDGTVTLKNAYLKTLAAGEYTVTVAYDSLGESYENGSQRPDTIVRLTVTKRKRIPFCTVYYETYSGQPYNGISFTAENSENKKVEYKLYDADDSTYTETAPTDAGRYLFRVTVPEDEDYKACVFTSMGGFTIKQKEVKIVGTTVESSRFYDGTVSAEIADKGTLTGVVEGDELTIVPGTAAYADKDPGKGKTVMFTGFGLGGADKNNYVLKEQPADAAADIVEWVADGSEYSVNSNDWISTDFIVTARPGYKIGLTDAADGAWKDQLTASKETDRGKLTFYVKNTSTGAISSAVTERYKIDKSVPEIAGVEDGRIYYVTQRVAVDDTSLKSVTVNGEPVEPDSPFDLAGDKDAVYTITAMDEVGNKTEYTITMKPISAITDAIRGITAENVKSDDAEAVEKVTGQILDIAAESDEEVIGEEQWNKLLTASRNCKELETRISEVAAEITRLTESVRAYDIDKITGTDKADIEQLAADIDTLLGSDNLNDTEREELKELRGTAQTLLDRISAAGSGGGDQGADDVKKTVSDKDAPRTGDGIQMSLWLALLFISSGAAVFTTVYSKKKRHSEKQ